MALLDVSDAVTSMYTGTYTLIRRTPGAIDGDGKVLPPSETTLLIGANIQPVGSIADDEQRHPAGGSSIDQINVWTVPEGSLDDFTATRSGALADRIVYQGDTYEIVDSLGWKEVGGYVEARFRIVDPRLEDDD